jgi:methyl-accepting chemotaxis protein
VNLAIAQLEGVTQQNAALVEEAAAASSSLEDQGRQLNDAVAVFRLRHDTAFDVAA